MGFGPLGTSWASAPNSLRVESEDFGAFFGRKLVVDVVEAVEEAKRNLGPLEESEDAMDGFVGLVVGLTRRRKMKKRATKTSSGCSFEYWISKIDDDDDDGVALGAAMQIGIRNHPPRAHKDSISMNQLQG